MSGVVGILVALGITLAVELPLGGLWWRRWKAVGCVALVNMLTNPLINLELTAVNMFITGGRTELYWVILALSEISVVAAEGLLLCKMLEKPLGRAMLFSLAANLASYFIGLLTETVGIL